MERYRKALTARPGTSGAVAGRELLLLRKTGFRPSRPA